MANAFIGQGSNYVGFGGASDASEVAYDNMESGLNATDVQGAIDELNSKAPTLPILFSMSEQLIGKNDQNRNVYMRTALREQNGISSLNITNWGIIRICAIIPTLWDAHQFKIDTSVYVNSNEGGQWILHSNPSRYYYAITLIYIK